jgi:hypothetical protein
LTAYASVLPEAQSVFRAAGNTEDTEITERLHDQLASFDYARSAKRVVEGRSVGYAALMPQ